MPFKKEKLYIIGINLHSFRPEQPALIIGYKMVKPNDDLETRHCFEVEYEDGFVDYIAVNDRLNYLILTMEAIIQREKHRVAKL